MNSVVVLPFLLAGDFQVTMLVNVNRSEQLTCFCCGAQESADLRVAYWLQMLGRVLIEIPG